MSAGTGSYWGKFYLLLKVKILSLQQAIATFCIAMLLACVKGLVLPVQMFLVAGFEQISPKKRIAQISTLPERLRS